MKDRHNLIFWMGGVITQSLFELLTSAFEEMGQPDINLLAMPDYHELSESFSLGKMQDVQFLEEINATGIIAQDLDKIILNIKKSFHSNIATLDTINLLPPKYQRWLVCEFPTEWFWCVYEKFNLVNYFKMDHIVFLSQLGLNRIEPDLFDFLPHYLGKHIEDCLYFDKDSKRIVSAINRSFPAALYVDSSRLEREFIMRNFIDRQHPLHTPSITL